MFPVLLLMAVAQVPSGAAWVGEITAANGQLTLFRGEKSYPARYHAGLLPRDRLQTGTEHGASFYLDQGPYVYLGPSTRVTILGGPSNWTIQLAQGEVRIASRDEAELKLETPSAEIRTASAILRIGVDGQLGTRAASEYGTATIHGRKVQANNARRRSARLASFAQPATDDGVVLDAGQELLVSPDGEVGEPHEATGQDWGVDSQELQLQSIVDATHRNLRQFAATACQPISQRPTTRRSTESPTTESASRQTQQREGQSLVATGSSLAIGFGSLASASPASVSAGLFSDSAQDTTQGMLTQPYQNLSIGDPFPGNIHLVTGESVYDLSNVQLNASEQASMFAGGPEYFSIGVGALPDSQVSTDFFTGTGTSPNPIAIPGFDAFVVQLTQYDALDATLDPAAGEANNVGYSGMLGSNPASPTVTGATPLLDNRTQFNHTATFALGEFRLRAIGPNNSLELAIRQTDQDRLIVKDPMGNDADDQVTVNQQVTAFDDVADPRFQPAAPTVKVPQQNAYTPDTTRFSKLDQLRKAAVTTVLADQLFEYAQRTGQTRFVLDGKIIDIKGYQK